MLRSLRRRCMWRRSTYLAVVVLATVGVLIGSVTSASAALRTSQSPYGTATANYEWNADNDQVVAFFRVFAHDYKVDGYQTKVRVELFTTNSVRTADIQLNALDSGKVRNSGNPTTITATAPIKFMRVTACTQYKCYDAKYANNPYYAVI